MPTSHAWVPRPLPNMPRRSLWKESTLRCLKCRHYSRLPGITKKPLLKVIRDVEGSVQREICRCGEKRWGQPSAGTCNSLRPSIPDDPARWDDSNLLEPVHTSSLWSSNEFPFTDGDCMSHSLHVGTQHSYRPYQVALCTAAC